MEKAKNKGAEGASNVKYSTLVVQGTEYKTLLTPKYENKKAFALRNPKEVKSFLPGTILEIKVKVGAKVKLGDPLLVFEAMKMHNVLKSTVDGTIKTIHVKVSDTIPNGTLLIEYE